MNRSLRIRGVLVVVVLLLSVWGLLPTIRLALMSAEDKEVARSDPERAEQLANLEEKAIRQGLDLQGGMYLVLEIDITGMTADQARDALQRVREIVGNRVDQFGVSEPVIQTQGTSRIVVQLPGLLDAERAKRLIGQTAQLEFRLVRPLEEYENAVTKVDEALRKAGLIEGVADPTEDFADAAVDTAGDASADEAEAAVAAADTAENPFGELPSALDEDDALAGEPAAEMLREYPFSSRVIYQPQLQNYGTPLWVEERNVARVRRLVDEAVELRAMPRGTEFQFGMETVTLQGDQRLRPLYLVSDSPSLTGDRLTDARTSPDPNYPANWQVEFSLDRKGGRQFAKVTGDNVGRKLAISLDGQVNSAPTIQGKIPTGSGTITGRFTNAEASDLALLLRAGALPTDVHIEEERTVGPSLGRDSIRQGVTAALFGLAIVVLFIIVYYGGAGVVTVVALVTNIIILLAVLAQFSLVLTLPGIAGIILTIGMAVDANVLVNERIREELRKSKTVRAAVESGYANASRTIIDANVTTLIAAGILLWFGTGPILGFAVTLTIGILASLFTALVQSRVIMEIMTRKKGHQRINV